MGCGQSKIHLYPRKSKSKANGKKGGHADSDAETDEDEGHIEDTEKCATREREKNEETSEEQSNKDSQETDEEVSVSLLRAKNLSLLQSQEISTSQQNFFRMLDRKIEEGPDYDAASETEIALEEARLNALVQHWESASITASICSSASRSLQTTPVRQAPKQLLGQRPPPISVLQQSALVQQQQTLISDFLPHSGGAPPIKYPQQNQPIVLSHMNTQIAAVPQVPISMLPEASTAATANSSNALAILQAAAASSSQSHHFTLGLPQPMLVGKPTNVSPKRIVDNRLLMNPIAQQMQTQIQSQFIPTSVIQPTPPPGYANGGRPPQPALQMAYFGQYTAPTNNMQHASLHDTAIQQQQQQQPPLPPPTGGQSYYGDIIHSVQQQVPTEYRFPPAISVRGLAPQVQRQLRETQELIKDSCPQYAAGYGSPGPPNRSQARNPNRRPTLETQFSQELS